jgi:hypothetical protein
MDWTLIGVFATADDFLLIGPLENGENMFCSKKIAS